MSEQARLNKPISRPKAGRLRKYLISINVEAEISSPNMEYAKNWFILEFLRMGKLDKYLKIERLKK